MPTASSTDSTNPYVERNEGTDRLLWSRPQRGGASPGETGRALLGQFLDQAGPNLGEASPAASTDEAS